VVKRQAIGERFERKNFMITAENKACRKEDDVQLVFYFCTSNPANYADKMQ